MIGFNAGRRFLRRHLFRLAGLALVVCAVLFVYARVSRKSTGPFALAGDVPRGALVYAQFSDLPALVKHWDESKLKEEYLASTNFQQFQTQHLALKLIERWTEFNDALGFPLDALTVGEAAENRAALAVYDFGRLEMVFVAPSSEEKLAATQFFQNTDQFQETKLPDGTAYYSRDVDVENGRRQQKFAFAYARGRVVLATSEQLLLRTLSNINGRSRGDRLGDDPSFRSLSAEIKPHALSIWMDQSKLNNDWYFKRYWLMRNTGQLKNIRACLLDLELRQDKWVEHRDFLLASQGGAMSPAIPAGVAQRIERFIPDDAPYFKLRALDDAGTVAALVRDTYMDLPPDERQGDGSPGWSWRSFDNSDFYPDKDGGENSYYSLDPKYDSSIDDPEDAKVEDTDDLSHGRLREEAEQKAVAALRDSLAETHPLYSATIESPQSFDGPLFAEFRKGAVITLRLPGAFQSSVFESAVANLAQSRLMIAGSNARLSWADAACGGQQCRELALPMLGWGMYYALKGPDLMLANGPEMLGALLKGNSRSTPTASEQKDSSEIHDLTVIRLEGREQAFDSLMRRLDAPRVKAYWATRKQEPGEKDGPSQEFFSGNISSLLDVASPVREIRIKRSLRPARLREEVEIAFK